MAQAFEFGAEAAQVAVEEQTGDVETLDGEGRLDDVVQSESYEVELDRGHTVTITTEATSGDLDTVLFLFDPNGNEVATNDDINTDAGNYNSQIVYTTTMGGTYTIEVTRYLGRNRISVTLRRTSRHSGRRTVDFPGAHRRTG